jgi:LuxR family transcriptional regulator of csgAB operon
MSADALDIANSSVYIISPVSLQTELLLYVIKSEIGTKCSIFCREGESLSFQDNSDIRDNMQNRLFLIDTADSDFDELLNSIAIDKFPPGSRFALFNLDGNAGVEKKALAQNIRGFFYKDDRFDIFLKGIRAIFRGEIWLPRNMLLRCVLDGINDKKLAIEKKTALSSREIEILTLVSMGSTNEEIANKLCISTNTVKTHLYNIFKKIKVENRLQAALWAGANL